MARSACIRILCLALSCLLLWGTWPAPEAHAQQSPPAKERGGLTPQQAAAKARAAHGGKVLKVERKGRGYRVRLLLDSGRVITVSVD